MNKGAINELVIAELLRHTFGQAVGYDNENVLKIETSQKMVNH